VVYSRSSRSVVTQSYANDAGGGGKTRLTRNDRDEFDPAFSPDGKRIACTGLNKRYDNSAIYTISAGGGDESKVAQGSDPSYSPDGKKIAYTWYKGPLTGIYKIDVGGGGKVRVTPRLEFADSPSWGSRP
jgi:TolB protein